MILNHSKTIRSVISLLCISVYLFVNFFVNNFIMTGEPTHTASEMAPRAPATVYQLSSEK